MAPKCEPLCCFSDRLYFTTFPHPAPSPATLNRLSAETNNRPRVRPRPRGVLATSPDEEASYYYFTIDDQLLYLSFFQDWGPLNIAMVYKACILIHELLEDKDLASHRLVLYSSNNPKSKANAALLMALYAMIVQRQAPWEAFHPIAEVEFMPFRDAGRGPSDFNLNIQDCLWGVWKAMQNGLCDMNEFDVEDYEFYEKVENGDWNWITPNFIAFASPVDQNWIKRQKTEGASSTLASSLSSSSSNLALQGKLPTPFLNCLEYFEKNNIKMVVRLNNQLYDRATFLDRGIDHMELYFDDGTNPTDEIVRTFLDVADRIIEEGGVVAVHCKAGLGRTATLIGAYLVWKYGFTANEAIAFMRIVRPGSVVGPQQQYLYLKQLEWSKWAAIDEMRKIQAVAAAPAPPPAVSVVTPATPPADTDEEHQPRLTTPTGSGIAAMPLPPVTPSRHVAAAAAKAKAIAPPGQPRKTPNAKRAAPAHDSDDEDDPLGIRSDSDDSDEMNDVLPSLQPIVSTAAAAARIRARAGSTSKASGKVKVGGASRGVTASEQRPSRVTRSTAGAAVIRKGGGAGGGTAGAAGASVVASPTKATTGQRPNKIPRLAMGKSTVGLAAKAAAAAKNDSNKPVPLPTTRSRLNPIPPPTPSRLPTLVPTRSRLGPHHSNSVSDAAAAVLLTKKSGGVGASKLKTKDDSDVHAWMSTDKAAGVVVTSVSGDKLTESRPGLRSSVRRRRSSFSSADVVA